MSGGGKGKQSSTTTSQTTYSPQEEARRQQIFDTGEGLYNAMAPGAGTYRGPAPVGFDPATWAAQSMQLQNANVGQSLVPEAQRATAFALNDAKNVNSNPYLQGAINAAIRPQEEAFARTTIPGLRLSGVSSGSMGSSRQGIAEGLAAQGLQRQVGDTAVTMANRGYETGLDASMQALRALPTIMSGISAPASMVSAVGAQRENLAQELENYNAAQRIQQINGPWELLNAYAGLLQGMSNPITTTTGTMPRQGISPTQAIGSAATLASMAGKFLS